MTSKPTTRKNRPATTRGPKVTYGHVYGYAQEPEVVQADLSVVAKLFWWCNKNRVELAPMAAAGLLFSTSAVMYKTHNPAIGVILGAALTGGTWAMANKQWDRDEERWYARLLSTAATLWLIAACVLGPVNPVVFWALVIGTIAAAIPWYRHKLVRPHEKNVLMEKWAEKWAEIRDRVGLPGSRIVDAEGDDDYATLTLQLVKGVQRAEAVKQAQELIAGAWDMPVAGVRVEDMRKVNASKVKLFIRRVSIIDAIVKWSDSEHLAPKTVTKPFVVGRKETGEWKLVDARGHWMIVGQTRGGKSNEIHALMANITGAYDEAVPDSKANSVVFFIDLKGGSVGGRWIDCIDWFAATLDEASVMLDSVNKMIDARSATAPVGDGDGDQLVPTPERPAVFIVFDECAEGLGISSGGVNQSEKSKITGLCESIARRGAAMNFYLVLAGQDGSLETYGTEKLRGNLTRRMCFRVAKKSNAQYVLDGYTTMDVTGLEDGQFFYHERGDDQTPIRGQFMTPKDNPKLPQQLSMKNAAHRPALDAGTARGGGMAYSTRFERYPEKFRKIITADVVVPAQRQEETTMVKHDENSAYARAKALEVEAGLNTGKAVTVEDLQMARESGNIDLARDIKDTTDMFCMLLANAPVDGIRAKSLYETVGVGKQWMYDRLGVLEDRELVEQPSRGFWRASHVASAIDLREAIDFWVAERKQLVNA